MNKWTRRLESSRASAGPADSVNALHGHHYFAFLSYSHQDSEAADWLHEELERFRVPTTLAGKLTANGVIPARLTPIFRDRHDLAAGDDLTEEIRAGLLSSRALIVLCSPSAARSKWVNAEIDSFKRLHPDRCIVAAIVDGEPLTSGMPGREGEECFPPALVEKYNRRGKPTGQKAEPLAADLREGKGGRRVGFLKIVAGILGVGLDDLVQREQLRRQRRLALVSAGSLIGMVVASALAVTAIQARDAARDQRREAEALIGFMLGDLKDKLVPIGRLDALDGVGSKVLAYYQKQGTSDLPDAALSQRSRALSLMAEVATARGDSDGAFKLYREAMAGTAEAVRRKPDDPQRLFDHAQNVFYYGQLASQDGRPDITEAAFRQYKQLADTMVALDPNNMKYRMEVQYADTDLGEVLYGQRRFAEAEAQFSPALKTIEAFANVEPTNPAYQQSLSEALGWLADSQMSQGKLDAAVAIRERQVALLNRLFGQTGDVGYEQRLLVAQRGLGALYLMRGQGDLATQHFQAAVANGNALIRTEPANTSWLEYTSKAQIYLAGALAQQNRIGEAKAAADSGCAGILHLLRTNSQTPDFRSDLRDCRIVNARVALASNSPGAAVQDAEQAVAAAKSVSTGDRTADAIALARSYRVLGDSEKASGDIASAKQAWSNAAAALPAGASERPSELRDRILILDRVGREPEAQAIAVRLQAMGYRNVD